MQISLKLLGGKDKTVYLSHKVAVYLWIRTMGLVIQKKESTEKEGDKKKIVIEKIASHGSKVLKGPMRSFLFNIFVGVFADK